MKPFFDPEPVIFGRGGGVPGIPSSTKEAFRKGIELGADVLAATARLTADDALVLLPEEDLSGSYPGAGTVRRTGFADIRKLNDGYLSLGEALEEFPDRRFNITLPRDFDKGVGLFLDIVGSLRAQERVLVQSFNARHLAMVRERFPVLATSFSLAGIIGFYALYRMGLLSLKNRWNGDAMQTPESIGTSYIANGGVVRLAQERGYPVQVMGVDKEANLRRVFETGANGVITGDVALARRVYAGIDRS